MDVVALQRITASLNNRGRASIHCPRSDQGQSWEADYGSGKESRFAPEKAQLDTARLDIVSRRDRHGVPSASRKNRMDNSASSFCKNLWVEVKLSLCPGTRVFVACAGVAMFIVIL